MNAAPVARVVVLFAALGVGLVACGSGAGAEGAQSEVAVRYAVSPTFNGTIYQVQSDAPIDSKPLTSAQFERELVQATGACDPGGGASLSRRLTLTQSGEFDTYTQAGAAGDGVKLKIRVSSGQNASECPWP